MAADSILTQTARGAGWAIGWRLTTRLLGLVNTFVLVRLLVPGDFGLVAVATGYAQAIAALSALGIEEAVIRERAPTRAIYDTAFTINLLSGLATALVVAASAWPAALFFKDPRLTGVLLALAACAIVTAFENIGTVEFRRDFAFHREFRLLVIPRLAAIGVTIAVAELTRSHWALVAGIATSQVAWIAMGYAMHPHRPRLTLAAWRQLAGFSFWSWAISTAAMVRDRLDGFVIGRVLDLTLVGIYAVGTDIAVIPTYELAGPLSRACMPGFAAALRAGDNGAVAYLRILAGALLVAMPAGFGISLVADQVVLLALGPHWAAAAAIVRVVGIAGVSFVLGTITASLLAAHAMLARGFAAGMLSLAIRLVAMLLLIPRFGLAGAAAGWAVATTADNLLLLAVAFHRFRISPTDLLRQVWRGAAAVLLMALVLERCGLGWTPALATGPAIVSLIEAVGLGGAVYGGTLLVLWQICGRPEGGEADLLRLLRGVAARLPGRARHS